MKFKNIKRTVATALAIATIGTTAAAVQNAVANPLYAVTSTKLYIMRAILPKAMAVMSSM